MSAAASRASSNPTLRDLQAFLKTVLRPQDRAYLMSFANRLR